MYIPKNTRRNKNVMLIQYECGVYLQTVVINCAGKFDLVLRSLTLTLHKTVIHRLLSARRGWSHCELQGKTQQAENIVFPCSVQPAWSDSTKQVTALHRMCYITQNVFLRNIIQVKCFIMKLHLIHKLIQASVFFITRLYLE